MVKNVSVRSARGKEWTSASVVDLVGTAERYFVWEKGGMGGPFPDVFLMGFLNLQRRTGTPVDRIQEFHALGVKKGELFSVPGKYAYLSTEGGAV
jgi:hypothetical protein